MAQNLIRVGEEDTFVIPKESLGKIIFDKLKTRDPKKIVMVDSKTGTETNSPQLLRATLKLAANLKKLRIQKGDIITVIAQNSPEFLVTILAALFLGATLNLLNHDSTATELRWIFATWKPKLVFCTKKTLKVVTELEELDGIARIIFDGDESTSNSARNYHLLPEVEESELEGLRPADLDPKEDLALLLTSSGTTGLPKMVALTHANLRCCMLKGGDHDWIGIGEGQVTLAYAPIFHSMGCTVCLICLIFGTKLVVMERFAPQQFLKAIQDHKVSILFVVPTVLHFLAKTPLLDQYDVSSIRQLYCGTAPLSKEMQDLAEKRLGLADVQQMYGLTETCGVIAITPKNAKKFGSVGRLLPTIRAKVRDPNTGKVLGVNEVGELCIAGDGVMKGYFRNEEETRKAFDEEGFLKTGDLGYYDEDDYFYVVDRLKDIIKYKGFQVAPVELESILMKHPAVKDAAVIGIPDEKVGELPLAFVAQQENKNVTENELIRHVAGHVSTHKQLHGGVRFVGEIPRNASGKILRRKLKELI